MLQIENSYFLLQEETYSEAQVGKDLLAIDKLMGDYTDNTEHCETAVLQLLGAHLGKPSGVGRLQGQGVEINVTRVVARLESSLGAQYFIGTIPSRKGAAGLDSSDDHSQSFEEVRRHSADLVQVTDDIERRGGGLGNPARGEGGSAGEKKGENDAEVHAGVGGNAFEGLRWVEL
jgi:hypothetical protein